MGYTVIIKYNDKHVQKYLKNAERDLAKGSGDVIKKMGRYVYAKALNAAPFKTGALRSSIILQRIIINKNQKSVILTTKDDSDSRRKASFLLTRYKTFVNYLHNGEYAYLNDIYSRKNKIHDFLTNDALYQDVDEMFEVSVIGIIQQSFK